MEKKSHYDFIIHRVKNNKIIVIILLLSGILVWLSTNIDAAKNIIHSFQKKRVEKADTAREKKQPPDSFQNRPAQVNNPKEISTESDDFLFAISILSDPVDLDIYVDNKFMGKTNCTIQLKKGAHEIKLMTDPVYKEIINIPQQQIFAKDFTEKK